MTSCIKSEFARRIRFLTCRSRFASPRFVIKAELRHIWKFWIARDRFTAPNFHSQVREVTNSAAWSNCIGHWEEGGSGDVVQESRWGRGHELAARHLSSGCLIKCRFLAPSLGTVRPK